jgi:predicted RNase H-like HicB family nuclease
MTLMQSVKIVYWEEDGGWLGYLQEYPDYWTQGETLEDLEEHLKDLYQDLASGEIPGIRKVRELLVS